MVKVPDVTGLRYEDACSKLAAENLKYSLNIEKDTVVEIQIPEAGEIVKNNTIVVLETVKIMSLKDSITKYLEDKGISKYGKINIALKENYINISENGKDVLCIGNDISHISINEITVEDQGTVLEYKDYEIKEGNIIEIRDLPVGVELTICINIDGYDEMRTRIMLTNDNMQGEVYKFNIYLNNKESEMLMMADPIWFIDKKGKAIDNVLIYVEWEHNTLYGPYVTGKNGKFPNEIWLENNITVPMRISYLIENKQYDHEIVTKLHKMIAGEKHDIYIILDKDNIEIKEYAD